MPRVRRVSPGRSYNLALFERRLLPPQLGLAREIENPGRARKGGGAGLWGYGGAAAGWAGGRGGESGVAGITGSYGAEHALAAVRHVGVRPR